VIRHGITHGVTGYKRHRCRCTICCKAREVDLELRRERESSRKYKSRQQVGNVFEYDTLTLRQYNQQRQSAE